MNATNTRWYCTRTRPTGQTSVVNGERAGRSQQAMLLVSVATLILTVPSSLLACSQLREARIERNREPGLGPTLGSALPHPGAPTLRLGLAPGPVPSRPTPPSFTTQGVLPPHTTPLEPALRAIMLGVRGRGYTRSRACATHAAAAIRTSRLLMSERINEAFHLKAVRRGFIVLVKTLLYEFVCDQSAQDLPLVLSQPSLQERVNERKRAVVAARDQLSEKFVLVSVEPLTHRDRTSKDDCDRFLGVPPLHPCGLHCASAEPSYHSTSPRASSIASRLGK
jgi:hypothetical protein